VRPRNSLNLHNDGLLLILSIVKPAEEGMKNLGKMGIKTIINLRVFHSDLDKIKKTGLLIESERVRKEVDKAALTH
jgi:hypothetical protein